MRLGRSLALPGRRLRYDLALYSPQAADNPSPRRPASEDHNAIEQRASRFQMNDVMHDVENSSIVPLA